MDLLSSPYCLHIVILYVSVSFIYLFYSYYWNQSKKPYVSVPPGSKGLPFFGETLDFTLAGRSGHPEKFVNDRITSYSSPDVFRTVLLGQDMAVFCGSSGNKFVFSGDKKYVTAWFPSATKKILLFPETIAKFSDSNKMNKFLPEFLKPEALQRYVPIMDSLARKHMDRDWAPFKEVKVHALSKKHNFALACRLFFNITDPDHVARVAQPFEAAVGGLTSLPINLPGTRFNRAIKGGKRIREELVAMIRQRRKELFYEDKKEPAESIDLLTKMLLASDEQGNVMNEMEISNKIIGLLIASHDTVSTAITFVVNYLAQLPHIYDKVFQEQREIVKSKAPGELLSWEDIQKMKYSWNVACEAMRLSPPAQGAFREAITDFSYAGCLIPKGWKAYWTVHSTHKNPNYFQNPEEFDPSRFEGKGPAPFTFVPFGGGPRMCPGREYARLEILVFIHNLVKNFKLQKVNPNEKVRFSPHPVPVNGLPVRLFRHDPRPVA
jgi:beta-amyrin 28-monooxygenase